MDKKVLAINYLHSNALKVKDNQSKTKKSIPIDILPSNKLIIKVRIITKKQSHDAFAAKSHLPLGKAKTATI